ncbi:MAG: hypothetical protein K6F25_03720 [Bacteroidales bacterium]|nr:hypothetical protein [Bacteroidales bacterium]
MKKNLIFTALGIIALASCQQAILVEPGNGTFTATVESGTKTTLVQDGDVHKVMWSNGDHIAIKDADGSTGVYVTQSTEALAVFEIETGDQALKADFEAWYPHDIYNDGALVLPATQTYAEGTCAGAPMHAVSSTTNLNFKNLCGVMRLDLSTAQTGIKVRKIIINADKGLSGAFTISEDAAVVSGDKGVTLDCGEEGVAIGETAVPFYIAIPAGTYNPLKITVLSTAGEFQTRTSTTDIVISRSAVTTFTLGFGEMGPVCGTAPVFGGTSQPWVQLWPGGPKWAKFNVGSTITTYADVTDYVNPDVVGGYYSFRGILDSTPNANKVDDTAYSLWGPNWITPTREQEQALIDNCEWTLCDGTEVQYEPGCTIKGWKVSGKEPGYAEYSIFLPFAGTRDQNSRSREYVGRRGAFWSSTSGGYGAYFLDVYTSEKGIPSHDRPHGCSVRAICVSEEPVVEGQFTYDPAHANDVLWMFENYAGDNPTLVLGADCTGDLTITRSDGVIDLGGHTISGSLYLQNNDPEKAITVKNGTVITSIDGKNGQTDYYAGQVILEDVTAALAFNDGHAYVIKSGTIGVFEHKKSASTPGTLVIEGGNFGEVYRYVDKLGKADDGSTIQISGGKFTVRPPYRFCAPGYYIATNTGDDKETYPYIVVEGNPAEHWFDGPITDLSATETANTYIVSAPGSYKIKATVKGNGGRDPLTGTVATTIDPADISGAAVLWELAGAGLALKYEDEMYQIDYKDGYILFNTPDEFVPGAAYVAVYKDCDGGTAGRYDKDVDEVLWSWMIWSSETPSVHRFADLGVMDRNLGAFGVGKVQYRGCAYEWGRKDPFPGCTNGSYTPSSFFPSRMEAYSIVNFDAEGMTVAYSVAHPTTYPRGWGARYWQTEEEFTTGMWWDGEKTIYDPSPAGWKVPNKDELNQARLSAADFPGGGFLGNCQTDFGYGNPGSAYYWTSTGVDRNHAWAWYGGSSFSTDHVDNYVRSGYTIRCVEDKVAEPVPTVLGAANTYMISEAGNFSFDATVKGNGGLDPLTGKQATRIPKDSIAGVKVLWEIYEQGRAIKHDGTAYAIEYADGTVTLSTPDEFVPGAACVAIYDTDGVILWSWLIWATPEPGTQEHNGALFMDRNLGAIDPGNGMRGFLYQWGRKDAFSAATGSYSPFTYVPEANTAFTTINGIQSVAFTIANPTVHINNGDSSSWMSKEEYNTLPWRDDVKTIYDPSPCGWRVPTDAEQNGLSGLPGTGFSNSANAYGNPGSGYYRTSTFSGYPKAFAYRQNGQQNNWGTNPAMAIRCVKEKAPADSPSGGTEPYGNGGGSYGEGNFNE